MSILSHEDSLIPKYSPRTSTKEQKLNPELIVNSIAILSVY